MTPAALEFSAFPECGSGSESPQIYPKQHAANDLSRMPRPSLAFLGSRRS